MNASFKFIIPMALILGTIRNASAQSLNKQNTYQDALKLADILRQYNTAKKPWVGSFTEESNKILSRYGAPEQIKGNPFFNGYFVFLEHQEQIVPNKGKPEQTFYSNYNPGNTGSAQAMGGNNWQGIIINGLATFMAGRFKEEVIYMGIDNVFSKIVKDPQSTALVQALFPKSFEQVKKLYDDGKGSYYTADLLSLRQIAQYDLDHLLNNLINNQEKVLPKITGDSTAADMLTIAGSLYKYGSQGRPLPDIISKVCSNPSLKDDQIKKVLGVADLLSKSLMDTAKAGTIWVDPFTSLSPSDITNRPEIRFYYGLLYEQLKGIPGLAADSTILNDRTIYAEKLQNIAAFVNQLNIAYDYLKTEKFNIKTPADAVTYLNYVSNSLKIFLSDHAISKMLPKTGEADMIVSLLDSYTNLIASFLNKDYQKAIPLFIISFQQYLPGDYQTSRAATFICQLASVEKAEDMEALLKAYSLPIGSSSVKRHSKFNVSLNGYVGLTGGSETAYGFIKQKKLNIGLTAPIGISTTLGNGSTTIFLSILDLGSIVNVRINNDTTSFDGLKFEQFLSPGVGLYYNFKKLPITCGAHFSYIPNLRTIKYEKQNATVTESGVSVTRFNFSILVDIPFLTIYDSNKAWRIK